MPSTKDQTVHQGDIPEKSSQARSTGSDRQAEVLTMAFNANQPSHEKLRAIVAERTSPILVWTGSGLSASAGMPTWPSLKKQLLEVAERKAEDFLPEDRNRHLRNIASIRNEANYWVAFERLKKELGFSTWNASVAAALTPNPQKDVPAEYASLWRIPELRGIMNLNLDGLATRAFSIVNPGVRLLEFGGTQAARLRNLPTGNNRFVVNLHGIIDDTSTWILTHEEIKRLSRNATYKEFIRICLSSWVNLFMGISVDDFAIGSHLQYLTARNLQASPKFWLTNRADQETDDWAEESGIQVIKYHSPDDSHAAVGAFLEDLLSYVAADDEDYPPVTPEITPANSGIPSPEELTGKPAEEIRKVLNAHASYLLSTPGGEGLDSYERFAQKYAEQIHAAWFLSTAPGKNELLGHTLLTEEASGAFGTVYRARGPSGEDEAVKILHSNIRGNREKLTAFRRGVRSMKILQERQVSGMVTYKDASEIPTFVSMEWIEGPNLAQAKEAHQIDDWDMVLRIGKDLARIIQSAQSLPERVLHRDIRPPNVMLEGLYHAPDDWRVVVLDFDLSWHRGASDQSVLYSASGYLAPEQIARIPNVSTRSGAVDSFGLGMTLYFLCSGEDPYPGQHTSEKWYTRVNQATAMIRDTKWRSLPSRFARCILMATSEQQALRIDVPAIANELSRLWSAHLEPDRVTDTELLAEEIAARSEALHSYTWDFDASLARYAPPTGVVYQVQGDESLGRVLLNIEFMSMGQHDRSSLSKYMNEKVPGVVATLKRCQWKDVRERHGRGQLEVSAWVGVDHAPTHLDRLAESIDDASKLLTF
ncbi:protein kinase [Streptomyces sp. HNM0663]|uniref:Protein kinase n=1 Tax=Streptomyces chengmaiensis TaxID=3040919 RepID=A0ABT6HJB3_9ACTN|nr:SIR2 family protein [Streptomyces chengmaiensis]MDH2388686.1 protein kinase [Streptomyces chengmaiensis]